MSDINFDLIPADKPRRRGRPPKSIAQAKQVREAKSSQTKMNGSINGRADLGSWIWGAADILRGAVSPDDYVDFVVPLLFYKRLSDSYQEEYRRALAEFKDEKVAQSPMFHKAQIPDGCHWEDVRKTSTNVGAKLNQALADIAKATPSLDRVINRVDFNNPNAIPEDRLVKLIEHFSQRNLANGNVTPDILGDGYEYLLKMFNEVAPTRAGEFYTPREVVKVLVECLKPEEGFEVYDPCCGSGGMLIESYYYLKRLGKDPKKLFLYGQELNDDTWAMSKMNVFLHDMEAQIVQGDTFANPKFLEGGGLKRFDLVIAARAALAEYHGQEVSSIQALNDIEIKLDEVEREETRVVDYGGAAEVSLRVLKTFEEQAGGWRKRNLFERQWVQRDFKKYTGMSADDMGALLRKMNVGFAGGVSTQGSEDVLKKLMVYWIHQQELLKGYEKNAEKLSENTKLIDGWIADIRELLRLLCVE